MRYLVIFPEAENIHLVKDVGMIPYALHRYCGYDTALACYRNGEYPYAAAETKGLGLSFIKRASGNTFTDGLLYILKNRKQYDVLQTFHLQLRSLLWMYFFKIWNSQKKTYLKLDANAAILQNIPVGIKGKLYNWLLHRVDLVSVETRQMQQLLEEAWHREVAYVPNGFFSTKEKPVTYAEKKNQIITVGRIGAPEKATDVLLEAFALFAAQMTAWELELVGPVDERFRPYMDAYFEKHPELKTRVNFRGAIYDRKLLYEYYAAAKIFCLTSKWESFGIALLEAADAGCYLVTSDVLPAEDITAKETYGTIFPVDDVQALTAVLTEVSGNDRLLRDNCDSIQDYVTAKFSWHTIVQDIDHLLKGNVL